MRFHCVTMVQEKHLTQIFVQCRDEAEGLMKAKISTGNYHLFERRFPDILENKHQIVNERS